MEQFVVRPVFGGAQIHWYTITNATVWLVLTGMAVLALFLLGTRRRQIIPDRAQSLAELLFTGVQKMIRDTAGQEALRYFAPIMSLFSFVLVANILGLLPMSFSITSQIAVTAVLALGVFISVTLLGFLRNGAGFLKLFWPSSAPLAIRPVLTVIELISYFVRPVSHSIRLAGNMMAGHAVIKVFAAFAAIAVAAPFSILSASVMIAFEVMVGAVQAYLFTILTCVYLRDALHPGH